MEKKQQEIAAEYKSSLADLNINSKPLINMLTILAEENIEHAPIIVKTVEEHIAKVSPDMKLPSLYLIDSIVKNVGLQYVQLFSQCIVNIFCGVFEKVNEKVREKMYTLRQTWNEVFLTQKLYTLDVKVNCMDPNWPITAKVVPKSPAIHVNPNFLMKKTDPISSDILRDKQRQLLELEKRKLELQLEATKQRLKEQEKILTLQTESVAKPPAIVQSTAGKNLPPGQQTSTSASNRTLGGTNAQFKGNQPQTTRGPAGHFLGNTSFIGGNQTTTAHPQNKVRVAPVSTTMLNSFRQRDPRLVRQQLLHNQQQQQQNHQTQHENFSAINANKTIERSRTHSKSPSHTSKKGDNEYLPDGQQSKLSSPKNDQQKNHDPRISNKKLPKNIDKKSANVTSRDRIGAGGRSNSSTMRNVSSSRTYDRKSTSRGSVSNQLTDRRNSRRTDAIGAKDLITNTVSPLKVDDKSPRRSDASKNDVESAKITEAKFKDVNQKTKSRNYVRRNRDKSHSPSPPSPPQDVDFRSFNAAAAASAIATGNTSTSVIISTEKDKSSPSPTKVMLPDNAGEECKGETNNSNELQSSKNDQNLEITAMCQDVDLRTQIQPTVVVSPIVQDTRIENLDKDKKTTATKNDIISTSKTAAANSTVENVELKRRSSIGAVDPDENSEPEIKKQKIELENIDGLFGTEDVDLRTLSNIPTSMVHSTTSVTTPPPPIISTKDNENWASVKGGTDPATIVRPTLEDVRAKLAKATRTNPLKLKADDKPILPIKKSRFNDVVNEDSSDGVDANIRTIINQAQELLESENMDREQYSSLVKTVIHINETNKLKEAQRRESLITNNSKTIKPDEFNLMPISDEDTKFSSEDDEMGNQNQRKKAFIEARKKFVGRIPKKGLEEKLPTSSDIKEAKAPSENADEKTVNVEKKPKMRRGRQSKWSAPTAAPPPPNPPLLPSHLDWRLGNAQLASGILPFVPPPPAPPMQLPDPWQNPPAIMFAGQPVIPHMPNIPLGQQSNPMALLASQLSNSVDNPNSDVVRTVNIDNVPKEIRFYDEIAIAFMEWDQPKEIGFQPGLRTVRIDDTEQFTLNFNEGYKTIFVDGVPHKMRFGCPTRELYIDDNWYECYFGDPPIGILIGGRVRIFKVNGPAPQVRIGSLRQDLVVGKINLIIDARIIVPVFLDSKIQSFDVDGHRHTLQFADNLLTVLIDGEPMSVEYGGLPKSLQLNGVKHFVRFGTLPQGVVSGQIQIKNMLRTKNFTDPPPISSSKMGMLHAVSASIPQTVGPVLSFAGSAAVGDLPKPENLQSLNESTGTATPVQPVASDLSSTVGKLNIDELFQKLLASGILNSAKPAVVQEQSGGTVVEDPSKKTKEKDIFSPIDLGRSESIKTRQKSIVQTLYYGMQCSSCGLRFPPEQTMKYSQHLDWHFRQNRRERDSVRKAHSRRWHYEVAEWVQYEEIEDLEDREKNYFESQQVDPDNSEEVSNQRTASPPSSCPAGSDDLDRACDMCHDKFEQFFHEETEEWHLRQALKVDDKFYHPLCYEDHKMSLTMDESKLEVPEDDNAVDVDDIITIKPEKESDDNDDVEITESTIKLPVDDDDDVIMVPIDEPAITEIVDDDDEETVVASNSAAETSDKVATDAVETESAKYNESMESDVEIQEPVIPFTDLDNYQEAPAASVSTLDESSQSSSKNVVKVKEEPKDDGYEEDAFEEVGTCITLDDASVSLDAYAPQSIAANATLDGNSGESEEAGGIAATSPTHMVVSPSSGTATTTTSSVNRIRINITKNVTQQQAKISLNPELAVSDNKNAGKDSSGSGNNLDNEQNKIEVLGANNYEVSDLAATFSTATAADSYADVGSTIEFTVKPELRACKFKIAPKTKSGLETSGLCSIM